MKKYSLTQYLREKFQALINSSDLAANSRLKETSFTRERSLTCQRLLLLILSGIRLPLQLAIDNFFESIGLKEQAVSKQALSKARSNLDPDTIKELFLGTAEGFSQCDDLELYNDKYRLCAIDGSDIALDNAKELKEYFGASGRSKSATTAMFSMCYDPLNNFILDASLNPYKMDERTASKEHICAVSALAIKDGAQNLFIMDRGYPSGEFIAELIDGSKNFVMRVRLKLNLDFDSVESDEDVSFDVKNKSYTVRVIKVTLKTGEVETLVTNLKSDELNAQDAGQLYFERWGVFENYPNA